MIKKKITAIRFIGLLGLIIMFSCNNQDKQNMSVIEAEFSHTAQNKVYLHELLPDQWPVIDSAITDDNGMVQFKVKNSKAGIYTIGTKRENLAIIQVNPGESQYLNADIRQIPNTYTVNGSEGSQLLKKLKKQTLPNLNEIDSLISRRNLFRDSSNFLHVKTLTDSLIRQVHKQQFHFQYNLVKNNKDELAVLVPLFQPFGREEVLTIQEQPELFIAVHDTLMQKYPDNPHVLLLHKKVKRYQEKQENSKQTEENLQLSKVAPDFTIQKINGEASTLSELKGDFILIHFWSEKTPDYKKQMKTISEVLQSHENLIHLAMYKGNDKLVWNKVADRYQNQSIHAIANQQIQKMYNTTEKHRLFLINEEGKIINKDFGIKTIKSVIDDNL
ncbi:MAG: redoxin domain-containing protein [Bacteroidales bacterium]|nr:redoxin domain-containing protein [Bacteroidales bacterium]MCF8327088.1 redoxin domain-containing protein [Bacteroidales bacterium]